MEKLIAKEDTKIITCAIGVFALSIFGLYTSIDTLSILAGWFSIIAIDVYFIYVILYAARKSDEPKLDNWEWGNWVPNKFSGVIVFVFLYVSAIVALAKIFMQAGAPDYSNSQLALYKSLISITSFSYDDYTLKSYGLQWLQMFQSFNGILLLTATFGFLISRISNFKEKMTLDNINLTLQSMKPTGTEADAILSVKKLIAENAQLRSEKEALQSKVNEYEAKLQIKP